MTRLAIIIVSVLPVACGRSESMVSISGRAPRTAVVTRGDIQPRVLLTGEMKAKSSAKLNVPQGVGWQNSIRFLIDEGSLVEAGDVVVELDKSAFTADLEEKRLHVQQASLNLVAQRATSALTVMDKKIARDRADIAFKKAEIEAAVPKNLRPLREWQEFQLALKRARATLEQAEAALTAQQRAAKLEVRVAEIELEKLRRDLSRSEESLASLTLKAPRDGIVLVENHPWRNRPFRVGDVAQPGWTLAMLPDLSAMEVEAHLSDVDSGAIAVGDAVTCTLDAYPDIQFRGTVETISPVAKKRQHGSLRRAFVVAIALDRTDPERMRPGLSVKVERIGKKLEDVLLAPRGGLDFSGDAPVAVRADGSRAEVTLGPCDAHRCVIKDGLDEGDRLLVGGAR